MSCEDIKRNIENQNRSYEQEVNMEIKERVGDSSKLNFIAVA